MALDWGPFPELERQIEKAAPASAPGPFRCRHVLAQLGGPWDLVARDPPPPPGDTTSTSFWPDSLPPRSLGKPRRSAGTRPARPDAGGWLRARLRRRPPTCHPDLLDSAGLAAALVECHAWLGLRNLRRTARLFSPFWAELPTSLGSVTSRAIIWTLYAYALDTHGAEPAQGFLPARTYFPGSQYLAGDALCLHFNLEDLVASLPRRLALTASRLAPHRRGGGLRSETFLAAYPALSSPRAPQHASGWLRALNLFIEASPVTQMVYADLIGTRLPPESFIRLAVLGDEHASWRNLWVSHLARSILAAMVSEAPVLDELGSAVEVYRRLLAEPHPWADLPVLRTLGLFQDYLQGLQNRRRGEAAERCEELRCQRAGQFAGRLGDITGMIRARDDGPVTPLHLVLLDMLVRHVVEQAGAEMVAEWQRLHQGEGKRAPHWADSELFGEANAAFRAFKEALFGRLSGRMQRAGQGQPDGSSSEVVDRLTPQQRQDLEGQIVGLLAPRWDPPEGAAGAYGDRLSNRFSAAGVGGVALPFASPNERGPSPAALLNEWATLLFPGTGVVTQRTVEQRVVEL